jgi:hypothetical protein
MASTVGDTFLHLEKELGFKRTGSLLGCLVWKIEIKAAKSYMIFAYCATCYLLFGPTI